MKARLIRCSTWLVAALFAAPAVTWSQDPPPPKCVLMLYGHDPNAPGVRAFTSRLRAIVLADSPPRVVFYDELLDLDRFPENARREELVNYIVEKYRGLSFDAILTDGTRALKFATERVSARFPGVPIVYGMAFEPEVDFAALPKNVTGRHHLVPFAETLKLARALQPDAERVVFVAGTGRTDSLLLATAVRDLTPLLGGMQLVVWQDWTYASLLQSMRTLPPRTITILSGFSRDRSGQNFNEGDLIASITRLASAPVYGIARNWVGDGVVGGVTMDFGDDGMLTGRLLLQVLDRASGGLALPPPEVARPAQVVDWRALERWGLSEGQLPPGTEVLFRPPSLWQQHRGTVLSAVGVLTVQSLLIVGLLYQRRARLRAELQAQLGRTELAHAALLATVGELTASISHELNQPLGAILRNAEAAEKILQRSSPDLEELRAIVADIRADDHRAGDVIKHLRALLKRHALETQPIGIPELVEDVAVLVRPEAASRRIRLETEVPPDLPRVQGDRVYLQQVLLNLVLNGMDALGNGTIDPRRVTVRARRDAQRIIEVSVSDTGHGIPAEKLEHVFEPFFTTKSNGMGLGLSVSRTLIEAHGGRIWAENNRERGTTFRFTLKVEEEAGNERQHGHITSVERAHQF